MSRSGATTSEPAYGARVHESMLAMVWHRFRRHPGAVAGLITLSLLVASVVLVGLSPYDPEKSDLSCRLQPPSWAHPFGTDPLGRDLLTRVLYGGRISLAVGLLSVPRNIKCSIKWETPAIFSDSYREPTPIKMQTDTVPV